MEKKFEKIITRKKFDVTQCLVTNIWGLKKLTINTITANCQNADNNSTTPPKDGIKYLSAIVVPVSYTDWSCLWIG